MKKRITVERPPLDDSLFRIDQKELNDFALPSKLSAATIIPRDSNTKKKKATNSTNILLSATVTNTKSAAGTLIFCTDIIFV